MTPHYYDLLPAMYFTHALKILLTSRPAKVTCDAEHMGDASGLLLVDNSIYQLED